MCSYLARLGWLRTLSRHAPRAVAVHLCIVAAACLGGACSTVRPQDKELLADPAMTYGARSEEVAQEAHVLANREGALPTAATSGGGCGCN